MLRHRHPGSHAESHSDRDHVKRPLGTTWLLLVLLLGACAARAPDHPSSEPQEAGERVLFTGAGDIGVCGSAADDSTAALLDEIPGLIWTTGDNAYPAGTERDFARCYEPSWGRHRHRTRPTPGNHEYWTADARAYFDYFGDAAGVPGKGWYSYRYGEWLVVALNSNLATSVKSEQGRWLTKLLAENPSRCTVAYFHHPLVSSGAHGSHADGSDDVNVRPLWEALYRAGAEIVLTGHDHHYERFEPMTPEALPDPDHGIRQFIVGTGGGVLRGKGRQEHPLSETFVAGRHGVLRLTLAPGSYEWAFLEVTGRTLDRGQGRCH